MYTTLYYTMKGSFYRDQRIHALRINNDRRTMAITMTTKKTAIWEGDPDDGEI